MIGNGLPPTGERGAAPQDGLPTGDGQSGNCRGRAVGRQTPLISAVNSGPPPDFGPGCGPFRWKRFFRSRRHEVGGATWHVVREGGILEISCADATAGPDPGPAGPCRGPAPPARSPFDVFHSTPL